MQNDRYVSPLKQFFSNKWVKIVLAIDAVVIIAVVAILIGNSSKTATVNFNIAPLDAKIQIDGQGEYYNGAYQIHPGSHTVTISRDNLTTKTFTIDFQPDYSTTVCTFLSNDGNFEFYEFKDNYESYQQLAAIASAENNITTDQDTSAEAFLSNFQQILSFLKILPIKGYVYAEPGVNASSAGFTIQDGGGKEKCERTNCLLVNYYGKGYEDAAMEEIEKAGYNPTDYQIIYERYD
ncbi:MAG: hypothetical protein Q4F56_00060 [Candidatus Saccharibacteria bacterium]|nr:hypothetical protein [Candidatus Saccharibacteria bacterium]